MLLSPEVQSERTYMHTKVNIRLDSGTYCALVEEIGFKFRENLIRVIGDLNFEVEVTADDNGHASTTSVSRRSCFSRFQPTYNCRALSLTS